MKDKLLISSQHRILSADHESTKKDLTLSQSKVSFLNAQLEEATPYKDRYNKLSLTHSLKVKEFYIISADDESYDTAARSWLRLA